MGTLSFPLHLYTLPILIILLTSRTSNGEDHSYDDCSSLMSCGNLSNIGYPFWGPGRPFHCGHPALQLHCEHPQGKDYPFPVLKIGVDDEVLHSYYVIGIYNSSLRMNIHLLGFGTDSDSERTCPYYVHNKVFDDDIFHFTESVEYLTLHECHGLDCPFSCSNGYKFTGDCCYLDNMPDIKQLKLCNSAKVPVFKEKLDNLHHKQGNGSALLEVLKFGFEVDFLNYPACYECQNSSGICVSTNNATFYCFRKSDAVYAPKKSGNEQWKLIVGLAIPGAFILLVALNIGFWCFIKPKFHSPLFQSRRLPTDHLNSDPETGSSLCGIPIFPYGELQEATNNFSESQELGDGGFGVVYYGKLRDGREVAVKRLYEKNYKRIGQFLNEIEILTRLRHPNLVTLYGCTSRHSRELLLVYEFIPNKTVADHLYGDREGSETLPWAIRMKIAIETASALSYLHASDIIHRDVKTYNILLDYNFSVKVADFGLSRLFPIDATHVSTAPQGTPGYLDPEYRICYQVTSKSDVYSFGVVLVELISSLPAVDISRQEDEINLSSYAMKRIQQGIINELVDQKLGFESNLKVRRMITLVAELAFQCLQQEKELRPTMDEVLEALEHIGRADCEALRNIQHPPLPNSVVASSVSTSSASDSCSLA